MVIGGVEITLGQIVDFIILIGALCAAIYKIWDFFAKPSSKIKKKRKEKEKARFKAYLYEHLPQMLYDHDLQTRDRYKADRQRYLEEIRDDVVKAVGSNISQNTSDLEALKISARDVLREKIMAIYHKNKRERAMTEYEREALTQYYKDYKALNGNSYIDGRYERMRKWETIYDDYTDDE